MSTVVQRLVGLLSFLVLGSPSSVGAHPLHTSLTRIVIAADGSVSVAVRVFADDFSAAVARSTRVAAAADHRVADGAAADYLSRALVIEALGRPVALQLVRQRRDGDVTWIELRGAWRGDLSNATIRNQLLMDLHRDQVNIVQLSRGSDSRTLLFSAGKSDRVIG